MLKNLGKISLLRMSFNKSEGYSLASISRVLKPSDKKKIFFSSSDWTAGKGVLVVA